MFRRLINDAKSVAGSVVAKYAARASVAVPFIVATGVATAAVTLMLIERFGHRNAYFMVAGGFVVIGLLAALFVRNKEHEEDVAAEKAATTDTADVATDAAAAAAVQMPLGLLGTLFSSPVGPSSVMSLVRVLGRNLPLLTMLIAVGILLWPKDAAPKEYDAGTDTAPRKPNGFYPSVDAQQARAQSQPT